MSAPADTPAPRTAATLPTFAAAPWLTAALPGTGGVVKESDADFEVEEIPAREPSGRGDHAWALIEKRGISTPELQRRLAATLGLSPALIGTAGMKDADAVARQWVSVPWAREPKLSAASIKDVELLRIERDDRPLAPGDLAGNRFRIHVRGLDDEATALARAQAILAELGRRGVPNYFGAQRFGLRGESPAVGACLLRGELRAALDLILGAPSPAEKDPRCRAFREAFARGDYAAARASCPGRLGNEARLLELLARGRDVGFVLGTLAPATRRIYLSAWQSLQFNRVLARRVERIDVALAGDLLLADGDRRGSARACVDPVADQPAVSAGTLHPTGPLFGEKVALADGEPGAIERAVFADTAIPHARLRRPAGLALFGERRVLRFAPQEVAASVKRGERTLVLAFRLPPGCFATTVAAEITKTFAAPA